MDDKRQMTKYEILRQTAHVPKLRGVLVAYLSIFQVAFIVLFAFFVSYQSDPKKTTDDVPRLYSMFMDVHSMMFVGFGFLMTFLKRYGFSSISFNFLIAAYVLEWALLVRGWIDYGKAGYEISVVNLLYSDFCAAAVLISLGAVLGKTSLTQLVIMATIEVVLQNVNEYIGLHLLGAVDVGESIYVHVFGAYFGLAVAKILHNKEIESSKESSFYHSDLFSMIGTLFLWLYWPSFNSAVAADEGQTRAIVNTFLSIIGSTISTFIFSMLLSKKRLNMVHIQNATLAGGVAVGAVADMVVKPYGALAIGTIAGAISVIGFEVITPALKRINLHDTCGVHNLHGLPGVLAAIISAIVAALATPELYGGNDRLNVFYPSRLMSVASNSTTNGNEWAVLRTASMQAGYQLTALAITLGIAILGGVFTGLIMRLPILETIRDEELMFDDQLAFITPDDFSFKLSEVKVQKEEEEMLERRTTHA